MQLFALLSEIMLCHRGTQAIHPVISYSFTVKSRSDVNEM